MYNGNDYLNGFYYAGVGGNTEFYMYMPKQITVLPSWNNNGNFTNSQRILQAVTPSNRTETIITLEEYNALQA